MLAILLVVVVYDNSVVYNEGLNDGVSPSSLKRMEVRNFSAVETFRLIHNKGRFAAPGKIDGEHSKGGFIYGCISNIGG